MASTASTSYGVLAQVLTGPLSVFTTRTRTRRPGSTVTGTGDLFLLRDTGSLNGTYVSRQLSDSVDLTNGADAGWNRPRYGPFGLLCC